MVCSESLLFFKNSRICTLFSKLLERLASEQIYTRYQPILCQCVIIIKSLIYFGSSVRVVQKDTLDSVLSNIEQVLFFQFFFTKTISCALKT